MTDFDLLISTICSPTSSVESRSNAERALLDIFSDFNTWRQCLPILYTANDTICFFFGIGLQRLVWRNWSSLSNDDKETLTGAISSSLRNRTNLQPFAVAKLEQVLASICATSLSLQPVLALVVDCDKPEAYTGLSAIRTVLDTILNDEPKLDAQSSAALKGMAQTIVLPLTNLCCIACSSGLQRYSEETKLMAIALEVMKIIISKLPLGAHVSQDVLNLLFTLAEYGADAKSSFHASALASIEILAEVMGKKFIPASMDPNCKGDQGATVLMQIVVKVVSLVKFYRTRGSIDDTQLMMALLDFIAVFAESHLERCLNVGSHSESVQMFFNELVSVSSATMDPKILCKLVGVWNRVLSIEAVKDTLIAEQSVCVPITSHLLGVTLIQSNPYLQGNMDELSEDLRVDLLVDPHIKEILSAVADQSQVLGSEEMSYAGSTLIAETVELLAVLVDCVEVRKWLEGAVSSLLVQNINSLLSNSNVERCSLDLYVLLRVVAMTRTHNQHPELAVQVVNLVLQIAEQRLQGKEVEALVVTSCQIIGQMVQQGGVQGDWVKIMDTFFGLLMRSLRILADSASSRGPSKSNTVVALCILLLQSVTAYADLLEHSDSLRRGVIEHCELCLKACPQLEVVALLSCVQDLLSAQLLAQQLTQECINVTRMLEVTLPAISGDLALKNGQQSEAANFQAVLDCVVKLLASMDAVTRNYSVAKPARRQALINSFNPLQTLMGRFTSLILQVSLQCWRRSVFSMQSGNVLDEWPVEQANRAARMAVAFNAGLLQCLGKKSFGKSASDVLDVCVAFVDSCISPEHADKYSLSTVPPHLTHVLSISPHNPLVLALLDNAGVRFVEQVLELAKVLAESTASSSPTVQSQIQSTSRLISNILPFLSDERVCAELLQPTLKAGIVSVRCYWQKSPRTLPFLDSITPPGNISLIDSNNGSNVRPIAQLLTQLCVGSIQSSTVAPQDALVALEGLLALSEQHQLFVVSWFQTDFWQSLFLPCLRVLLLRQLRMHAQAVERLFHSLCVSRLRFLRMSVDDEETAQCKVREFWFWVAQEALKIAADCQCGGDLLGNKISGVLNSQDMSKFDSEKCSQDVLSPIATEISRRM